MKEVTLELGDGARLTATPEALTLAFLEKLQRDSDAPLIDLAHVATSRHVGAAPAIGAPYDQGIYAGLTICEGRAAQLILLPDDVDPRGWSSAKGWAAERLGALPTRIDQLVLLQNLKSEFKPEAYWSCEEYASDAGYAWYQNVYHGNQNTNHKNGELRARAVRRLIL